MRFYFAVLVFELTRTNTHMYTNIIIYNCIYYILCVHISVIKPRIKMIPVKRYDIISLTEMISYHFTGLNCPIK